MIKQRGIHRTSCRQGIAATEMAIVLPVLMVIVLGCVDFGRVMHAAISLRGAVGAGAHYAATHRPPTNTADWKSEIMTTLRDNLVDLTDFDPGKLDVSVSVAEVGGIDYITIEANYPFEMLTEWPGLPGALTIRHRTVVAHYR